jgi:hypothetical protein
MALKPLRIPNIRHQLNGSFERTTRRKRLQRWLTSRATALSLTAKEVWGVMAKGVDADRIAKVTTIAPVPRTRVAITGTPTSGQTLTRVAGTYGGTPAPVLTYAWLRNAVVVGGQTGTTYLLSAPDVGTYITVRETATNSAGAVSVTSAVVGPIA